MPRLSKYVLTGIFLAAATPALGAQPTAAQPSFFGELVSIVVPLALIILGLFAVLHFARRRYGLSGPEAPMSVAQILPLGPRERIVLVKTRSGRTFAVGVSAQSVNLITELSPNDLIASTPPGDEDGTNSA